MAAEIVLLWINIDKLDKIALPKLVQHPLRESARACVTDKPVA